MDPETKKILDDYGIRIKKLEDFLFKEESKKKIPETKLKGTSKGVQELIEEGFFNEPKKIKDVVEELSRKGYFSSRDIIDRIVRRDFFKRKKILTRIKEDKIWKYAIQK